MLSDAVVEYKGGQAAPPLITKSRGDLLTMPNTSEKDAHEKQFTIIVNAQEKKVSEKTLTYDDVVKIAYPVPPEGNIIGYTITYRNADQNPSAGDLKPDWKVTVKNGTIFNVTPTIKS